MLRLVNLLQRPAAERNLLLQAVLAVAAMRIGLWLLPFRVLQAIPARLRPRVAAAIPSNLEEDRVAWAVTVAGGTIPAATCLSQALAAQLLLARRGDPGQLRIGVARSATGALEAHAWVESRGRIVIGGTSESVARYTVLPALTRGVR